MKIKICGLCRDDDIEYVNEARPDYVGFVFAPSKRQVSPPQAVILSKKLAAGIIPVGVFVDAPAGDIAALYRDGVIKIAQLHGDEDENYIARLKDAVPSMEVIKSFLPNNFNHGVTRSGVDYYLVDSGAGSGKPFNWDVLEHQQFDKPWFLAGGINLDNIEAAMALNPFAIDISSGAETDGIKDRKKIVQLVTMVQKGIIT